MALRQLQLQHRRNQLSQESGPTEATEGSGLQSNQHFFDNRVAPAPSHTASITWKSDYVKHKEEFERAKQRVRHVAPALFKGNAGVGIFPQNVEEWVEHKRGTLAMAEAGKREDIKLMNAQIEAWPRIPKAARKIKSVFEDKVFDDPYSAVLCLPTIWSNNRWPGQVVAEWPGKLELQWNGDSRQNGGARTKCGRFLPPPRAPVNPYARDFTEQPLMRPSSLDQTGPIFDAGPRPDEVRYHNALMDSDPEYEEKGAAWLGSEMMAEVGEWRPPALRDWQLHQLQTVPEQEEVAYGYMNQGMTPGFVYEPTPEMAAQLSESEQGQLIVLQEANNNDWY